MIGGLSYTMKTPSKRAEAAKFFSNFFVRSLPWQRTDIRLVLYNSNQLVQTNNKIYFPFWKESFP